MLLFQPVHQLACLDSKGDRIFSIGCVRQAILAKHFLQKCILIDNTVLDPQAMVPTVLLFCFKIELKMSCTPCTVCLFCQEYGGVARLTTYAYQLPGGKPALAVLLLRKECKRAGSLTCVIFILF